MRLLRHESGVVYLEFALMTPLLLLLVMGMIEMSRYILINQKLDKTSNVMADMVTQADDATTDDLDVLFGAVQDIMEPYTFNSNGRIIISSITKSAGAPATVNWQYAGGGTLVEISKFGISGDDASLPSGFTLNDDENVIVAEVFYQFDPLLPMTWTQISSLSSTTLYKYSIYKPRLGALETLTVN